MSRAGDRRALGTRNLRRELVGDLVDVAHVLLAGDHESGDSNLAKPRRRRRFEFLRAEVVVAGLELECLPLHLSDKSANLWIDVVGQPHTQVCFDGSVEVAALEG